MDRLQPSPKRQLRTVHGRLSCHTKLSFAMVTLIGSRFYRNAIESAGFATAAMRAPLALVPNNGFKIMPTSRFVRKPFSKLIDIHGIISFLGDNPTTRL